MSEVKPENILPSIDEHNNTISMYDIREILNKSNIEGIEFSAPTNKRVGDAPILDNGLNILYAPQGYGKSYTAVSIAKESGLPSIFIDLESNGKTFKEYCDKNNVLYVYVGNTGDTVETVKTIAKAIKKEHDKAFIIIDSYSDLFPDDEGRMAKDAQKQLGDLHRFFMRVVRMPVLILDHATEKFDTTNLPSFKIEGNKSGKLKKTVCVLRLDKINGDIANGTYVTVERSRNQEALPVGHVQYYERRNYIKDKIQSLINDKKLNEEFTATDLKKYFNGDLMEQWRNIRDEISLIDSKEGKKTFWKLKAEEAD